MTGTTTGTRSAGLYQLNGYSGVGVAELLNTNDQTTVSSTFRSSFANQVSTSITPDIPNPVWGSSFGLIIDSNNPLEMNAILLSGDTVEYSIIAEEYIP